MPIFWKEIKTELYNKRRISILVLCIFFCIYISRKSNLQDVIISVLSVVLMLSIYNSIRNAYCLGSILATPMDVKQYCNEKTLYVGIKTIASIVICYVAYILNIVQIDNKESFIYVTYVSIIIAIYILILYMNLEVILLYLGRKRIYLIYILCSIGTYLLRIIVVEVSGIKKILLALTVMALQYICFNKLCSNLNYEKIERGWS